MSESDLRGEIVSACKSLVADGLVRGTSGNISVRAEGSMLITPTAVGYDVLRAEMIARMPLDDEAGNWDGPDAPSTEWKFHRDILRTRADVGAVVHTHAPWCTVLAVARRSIPAVHYMIAAFGGPEIRVATYARYGTAELSANVLEAIKGRNACLMANHGMVVVGTDLCRALWLAGELEALAHQHYHALAIGGGHVLTAAEIAETARGFETYGAKSRGVTN